MAINLRRPLIIAEARTRRRQLVRYLNLDGSRWLMLAIVLLCLVSLLSLWQTGVIATRGYAIADLQLRQQELLREQAALELRLAAAGSLERIEQVATEQLNMRPLKPEQLRYITVKPVEPVLTPPVPEQESP